MPTPVSAARQCLTDEAARALDDAVAVARRRSHVQTTSLHAVSALLALPSSPLREACARARSSAYLPRLQFRALELCVGVSLDRLPSAKSVDEPPVSNSLMAAIKRSQANQRRQPENFHLQQLHGSQQNVTVLKVELKHFILSILDDPIVSRVFGEAGFRSCDIKMAIVHPPITQSSRFSRSRCPPIFLCNLTDSDPSGGRSFRFPFAGVEDGDDENCRKIGEVLVRKNGKNPLLVGVGASDALRSFTDCVQRGKAAILPPEMAGLSLFDIAKEVSRFVVDGGSKEAMGLKFKELGGAVEHCSGSGVIVNVGEVKVLVCSDGVSGERGSFVVSELKSLLELHSGKLWLIGAAGTEADLKFLSQFPTVEKDWDLHLLLLTWKPPIDRFYSKSSLMGSFVPFGGFFPTPSDYKNPLSSTNRTFTRCHLCSEKFEQEKDALLKAGSTMSVADQHSASLPSWLRMAELDTSKGMDAAKTKDDGTALSAKILGLQKKWNDICQRVHPIQQYSKLDAFPIGSQLPVDEGSRLLGDAKQSSSKSNSKDSSQDEGPRANQSPCMPINEQEVSLSKQSALVPVSPESPNVSFQSKPAEVSKNRQNEIENPRYPSYPPPNLYLLPDRIPSSFPASVVTDLRLGTLHASTSQEPSCPKIHDHQERLQNFSGSVSVQFEAVSKNNSNPMAQSSSCSDPNTKVQFDPRDFKSLRGVLIEKVGRQEEAICAISQALSRCRTGNARYRGSNLKGDIWLTFLGPDRVGKRRIASALAEIIFGSRESLISMDLGSEDMVGESNSVFEELNGYDVKWGNTIVDSIAGELRKRPHSVVFLENIDKADLLVRSSISQAIKTGKFPDSHGRDVSINNMIFVTTSSVVKGDRSFLSSKESVDFSEERVLGAKSWQIQIAVGSIATDASRTINTNVRVTPRKGTSKLPLFPNKRKLVEKDVEMHNRANKAPRSGFDLNLPVEEMEEEIAYRDSDSDSISENSEAWLEDFFDQADENVVFKQFDFDALGEKILSEISINFQRTIGSEIQLEIDYEVMLQMLAAGWLSQSKNAVKKWVEQVLTRSFAEALQRYHLTSQSVVRLFHCEDHSVKERAPGVCLPAKIELN